MFPQSCILQNKFHGSQTRFLLFKCSFVHFPNFLHFKSVPFRPVYLSICFFWLFGYIKLHLHILIFFLISCSLSFHIFYPLMFLIRHLLSHILLFPLFTFECFCCVHFCLLCYCSFVCHFSSVIFPPFFLSS